MNDRIKNDLLAFVVAFALTSMLLMVTFSPGAGSTGMAARSSNSSDCTSYCDQKFGEFENWVNCHKECMQGKIP